EWSHLKSLLNQIPNRNDRSDFVWQDGGPDMEELDDYERRAEESAMSADTETTKWIKIQDILKRRLTTTDDFEWRLPISNQSTMAVKDISGGSADHLRYVGGFDVSYSKDDSSIGCGVLVVLDLQTLQVVYEDFRIVEIRVPYVPGFLAFREAPICLQLLEKMKKSDSSLYPQLLIVDGNGLLHPRGKPKFEISVFSHLIRNWSNEHYMVIYIVIPGFGSACHVGVLADLPTIGIGKNMHHVDGLTQSGVRQLLQAKENSSNEFITLKGFSGCTWGAAMRSSAGAMKPIFISVGHRISLDTAINIVKITCKYRVPEPVRQADIRSREHLKKHQIGVVRNCICVNLVGGSFDTLFFLFYVKLILPAAAFTLQC
ncbi:Endonuclease V, partial [Linum grandiflorum]